eukprot:3044855-Prymnesium_polylepis.1
MRPIQHAARRALEDQDHHDDDAAFDLVAEALYRVEDVLILADPLRHVSAALATGDGHGRGRGRL